MSEFACNETVHEDRFVAERTNTEVPGFGVTFPNWWRNSWHDRFGRQVKTNSSDMMADDSIFSDMSSNWRLEPSTRNRNNSSGAFEEAFVDNGTNNSKLTNQTLNSQGVTISPTPSTASCSFQYVNRNHEQATGSVRNTRESVSRRQSYKTSSEESKSAKGIISRFAERASLPGFIFLYTSATTCARVVWCCLLLLMLGGLTLHLYYLIDVYSSWPKNTKVSLGFSALKFPAVTFCNVNPARLSKLHKASQEIQELVKTTQPENLVIEMNSADFNEVFKRTFEEAVEGSHEFRTNLQKSANGTKHEKTIKDGLETWDVIWGALNGEPSSSEGKDDNKDGDEISNKKNKTDPRVTMTDTEVTVDPETTTSPTKPTESTTNSLLEDIAPGLFGEGNNNNPFGFKFKRSVLKQPTIPEVDLPVKIQNTGAETSEVRVTGDGSHTTIVSTTNDGTSQEPLTTDSPEETNSITSTARIPQSDTIGNMTADVEEDTAVSDFDLQQETTASESVHGATEATNTITPNGNDVTLTAFTNITPTVDFSVFTSSVWDVQQNVTMSNSTKLNNSASDVAEPRQAMNFINRINLRTSNPRSKAQLKVYPSNDAIFPEPSVASSLTDHLIYLLAKEERSKRILLGHQIEDMLVDCSFNGGRCHPGNFTLRTSATFGNCFTMDYETTVIPRSGPKYGLTLVIFLEKDEFLKGLTSGSGGHVVIHDKNTFPFPAEDGLALASGMEINIAIKMVRISRLDNPYGECIDGHEFLSKYGVVYTRRTCQHFCEQSHIMRTCGCYDSEEDEVQHIYSRAQKNSGRACSTEDDYMCMLDIQRKYVTKDLECQCDNPCSEAVYSKSTSLRQWPSDEYADILIETLCESRSTKECESYRKADKRQFAQNFIKLNIFYEDLNYENVTELASYESTQFFSDIGGALGLWLGLSIMSIMELGHLATSLMRLVASLLWKKVNRTIFCDKTKAKT